MKGTDNVVQFKQTFIRYNLHISRRNYDGKWEVVKRIPDPNFVYDEETWKGARTTKGVILKPMRWITHSVHNTRKEALTKAKEMAQ